MYRMRFNRSQQVWPFKASFLLSHPLIIGCKEELTKAKLFEPPQRNTHPFSNPLRFKHQLYLSIYSVYPFSPLQVIKLAGCASPTKCLFKSFPLFALVITKLLGPLACLASAAKSACLCRAGKVSETSFAAANLLTSSKETFLRMLESDRQSFQYS